WKSWNACAGSTRPAAARRRTASAGSWSRRPYRRQARSPPPPAPPRRGDAGVHVHSPSHYSVVRARPQLLPHAQANVDGVGGVVAAGDGRGVVGVQIASEQDRVAVEIILESQLRGQVALTDGHGVVGIDGVPDAGEADQIATEPVARLQAHLSR